MLVLSRKCGEQIKIGDNITVTIVGLSSNSVKIGIEAPASVPIFRQELLENVKPPRRVIELSTRS